MGKNIRFTPFIGFNLEMKYGKLLELKSRKLSFKRGILIIKFKN